MSLINNMLKELEKREVKLSQPYLNNVYSPTKKKIFNPSWPIITSSILFFFSLIALTFLLLREHPLLQIVTTASDHSLPKSPLISYNDTIWTKPGLITGVTLQLKDNITEISFMLDHPLLYRLTSNEVNNEFTIIFDDAQLQAELPPLNNFTTGLQYLHTESEHDNTIFHFRLNPGSTLKYVNLNTEDKNPELVIAIASPLTASAPAQPSVSLVKTPAMETLLSQQYQSALTEIEQGHYQKAVVLLSSLIKYDPNYQDARTSLAALFLNNGNKIQADKLLNEGLELTPDYVPFVELKARTLAMQGKIKQALSVLNTISPPMTQYPDYFGFIAALYERSNNDLLAIHIYKQLVNMNPQNSNWWFGLGVSFEKLGQPKEALNAYTKAMSGGQLNPDSMTYLQTRVPELQRNLHETS